MKNNSTGAKEADVSNSRIRSSSQLCSSSLVNVGLVWNMWSGFCGIRSRAGSRGGARHVHVIVARTSKLALHLLHQVLYLWIVGIFCHVGRVLTDVGKRSRHLGVLRSKTNWLNICCSQPMYFQLTMQQTTKQYTHVTLTLNSGKGAIVHIAA